MKIITFIEDTLIPKMIKNKKHHIGKCDRDMIYRLSKKYVREAKKEKKVLSPYSRDIHRVISAFREISPSLLYGNKSQRNAAEEMIKKFGIDKTLIMINAVISVQGVKYAPRATTPYAMWNKIGDFKAYFQSIKKEKQITKI